MIPHFTFVKKSFFVLKGIAVGSLNCFFLLKEFSSHVFLREVCKNKKVKKSGPGTTSPLTPPLPSKKWSPYCVLVHFY